MPSLLILFRAPWSYGAARSVLPVFQPMFQPVLFIFFIALPFSLTACESNVRKEMPPRGSLTYGEVVYVENDGSCPARQVIKVTGGSRRREIPRKYECVARPE